MINMIKEKALNSAYNLQRRVYRIFSLQSPTGLYILAREQASDGPVKRKCHPDEWMGQDVEPSNRDLVATGELGWWGEVA
jgi:hypothetical protein